MNSAPQWTPPRSKQELQVAEELFDQEQHTLKGAMSEGMFDRAKTLSMMHRLYDLGFRDDFDFSYLSLEKLIVLVGIVSARVAETMIPNFDGNGNQDIRGAIELFEGR